MKAGRPSFARIITYQLGRPLQSDILDIFSKKMVRDKYISKNIIFCDSSEAYFREFFLCKKMIVSKISLCNGLPTIVVSTSKKFEGPGLVTLGVIRISNLTTLLLLLLPFVKKKFEKKFGGVQFFGLVLVLMILTCLQNFIWISQELWKKCRPMIASP